MTVRLARIRHDEFPRSNPFRVYPETVPMNNLPKGGKGQVIPYLGDWEMWTRSINTPDSAEWLFAFHSMLFNLEVNNPYKAESITCGGNAVKVIAEDANYAMLAHLRNDRLPPDADYISRPFLVQKVVCIDRETMELRKPADGKDVYFPLLSDGAAELWIAKERLEFFPALPFRAVVEADRLAIRVSPTRYGRIVGYAAYARQVTVREYRLRGSEVWGKIGDQRWILIQDGNAFTTSWTMETRPPVV